MQPPRPRRRRRAGLLLIGVGLLAGAACSTERNLFLAGVPGVATEFRVVGVAERHGYLDARLTGVGHDTLLRTFLPATERCRRALGSEGPVHFVTHGVAGQVSGNGAVCDAVGIGTLSDWRARRPETQGLGASPVPREQATWRTVHTDEETIFLRGRFPLARRVGWEDFGDSLAVVPNTATCRSAAGQPAGSLEYRPTGEPVLSIVSGEGLCPIEGLVQPAPAGAGPPTAP